MTYDCGDYAKVMDRALALSDWKGFKKRTPRVARRTASCAASGSRTIWRSPAARRANGRRSTCKPEGRVEVSIGTLSSGQGHETSFAQCVAEWLGVDFERIKLIQGDTDIVPIGGGSHSARSMRMGGIVMGKASRGGDPEGHARSPATCWRPTRPTSASPRAASP